MNLSNSQATETPMAPLLSTQELAVGYQTRRKAQVVLAGLNLTLLPGELVCLLGPNGAGKSTLLRTLAGLQAPLAGQLLLGGDAISSLSPEAWARKSAIVLTERFEGGNLSVYALAALGRHPHTGWSGRMQEADRAAVRKGLQEAGAWDLRERIFDELSDGEKQRVMLARALAQEPALLLLDEPTAFLDLPRRVETMRNLRSLARERGKAILLSTHDLDLAMRAADRLWLLPVGGPVISGLPEDLALSGAMGSVFDKGDVAFDLTSGQFRVHAHPTRIASVEGDSTLVFWAARALERHGYSVVGQEANLNNPTLENRVQIMAAWKEGKPEWSITLPSREEASVPQEKFDSLEAMMTRFKL